jgi:hypothetical protein
MGIFEELIIMVDVIAAIAELMEVDCKIAHCPIAALKRGEVMHMIFRGNLRGGDIPGIGKHLNMIILLQFTEEFLSVITNAGLYRRKGTPN